MINRATRLRWRRKFRRSRRQVEDLSYQAEENFERHFFHRLAKLSEVRRFVASWILLIVLLCGVTIAQTRSLNSYYQTLKPVAGGVYTEGIEGFFTNANPIYATSTVDTSVSHLVFAGLLKLDGNGKLINDLAESWQVDEQGDVYTVKLKRNLVWQDGMPLTADDVVFTFQTAQHPDAKSPLFQAWREVTIQKQDDRTVTFKLKSSLASFAYSLTTGIIPKHLLSNLEPSQLRSSSFNTSKPVGAGPFMWQAIETRGSKKENTQQHIGFKRFSGYALGAPRLEQFIINTYGSKDSLIAGLRDRSINAAVGLDQLPNDLTKDKSLTTYDTPMMAANMLFLRVDSDILKDSKVRQALQRATNISLVVNSVGYPSTLVDEPVLKGQFAYNSGLKQPGFDEAKANQLLDEAGWLRPADGQTRQKGKDKLVVKLFGQNTTDFNHLSQELQKAWAKVGVDTDISLQQPDDLQTTISSRLYDVLLSGITIGPDPDVFVYWHSSQFDTRSPSRLNFSDYKSAVADSSLEASRSRLDPAIRKVKLTPFLQAWHDDVPAIGLYQPRFLYITRGDVFNYGQTQLNTPADRFWNVQDWMIRQGYSLD